MIAQRLRDAVLGPHRFCESNDTQSDWFVSIPARGYPVNRAAQVGFGPGKECVPDSPDAMIRVQPVELPSSTFRYNSDRSWFGLHRRRGSLRNGFRETNLRPTCDGFL